LVLETKGGKVLGENCWKGQKKTGLSRRGERGNSKLDHKNNVILPEKKGEEGKERLGGGGLTTAQKEGEYDLPTFSP